MACGERIAKHGGQVNDDHGEMNFELVHRASSIVFHLEDHGQPVVTKGASAQMEVKRGASGSASWTAKLRVDGDNRFVASLPTGLVVGDSMVVDVRFANGSIANGRCIFGVKPEPRQPTFSFTPAIR